jgi:hypothetical protein
MITIAWIVLGTLLTLLLCFVWQGPDIFYHLYLGRRILETHSASPPDQLLIQQPTFVNLYWLFQLLVFAFYRLGGVVAASLLFAAAWWGALGLWWRTAGLGRRPEIGLTVALIGILIVQSRFEPRPEVFSYLILSLQIFWLARWKPEEIAGRKLWLFVLSEVVWANVHGYFVLGPMVILARLVTAAIGPARRRTFQPLVRLLVLTLLATLFSPHGFGTWRGVYFLWAFLRTVGGQITEFGPPAGALLRVWTVKLFWVAWAATLGAAGFTALKLRGDRFPVVLAGAGLYLSATAVRNLPLLVLLSGPLWGMLLARSHARPPERRAREGAIRRVPHAETWARTGILLPTTVAAALSVWVIEGGFHRSLLSETRFGFGLAPHAYPLSFAPYAQATGISGRIFNNAADGGFLEYHLPRLRLYMDSRYTDAGLVQEYFAALLGPDSFARLQARQQFDGVLLKVVDSGPVLVALLKDPAWRLAYTDLHRAYLVPKSAPGPRPSFNYYRGEDLAESVNGLAAIQWVAVLLESGSRAQLVEALTQLGRAPAVPSFVVQYALAWGQRAADREVIALARSLAPRMVARDQASRRAVEMLMRATATPAGAVPSGGS